MARGGARIGAGRPVLIPEAMKRMLRAEFAIALHRLGYAGSGPRQREMASALIFGLRRVTQPIDLPEETMNTKLRITEEVSA